MRNRGLGVGGGGISQKSGKASWWNDTQPESNCGNKGWTCCRVYVGSRDAAGGTLSCDRARQGPEDVTELETYRKLGIFVWKLCLYGEEVEWVRECALWLKKSAGHRSFRKALCLK